MSFVSELRRRNVFRVAAAYLVVGWLLTEILTTLLPELGAPNWASRAVNQASVAVLPFVKMSADEKNEYFSDGLTETLLHMLAQIPELQVAARTSSFAFKEQQMTAVEAFFAGPVTRDLRWRQTYAQPLYAPLLEDERIQAGLRDWEEQHAAMRAAVRAFLSDLSEA